VPADSFTIEAQDEVADDGVMEALDPGVAEADVMRGPPGAERLAAGQQLPVASQSLTYRMRR
jgi:hypothetical protein